MATDNRTQLNNCDQDTDAWAGDGGATDNTEPGNVYEGTASQGCTLSNALEREVVSTIGGTRNMTDATCWAVIKDSLVGTRAAGGYQVVLDDGTNEIGFYVGGYDFLPMPIPFFFWSLRFDVSEDGVFDTASRTNNYSGTYASFDESAVTGIGYGTIHAAKAKSENVYLDGFYFIVNGNYALTIDSGTSGTPETWADVVADDETNGSGMVSNLQGNKFDINASWEWGVSANQDSYFEDSDFQVFIDANDVGTGNFIVGATVGTGTNSLKLSNGLFQNLGTPSVWNLSDTDYNTIELDTVQWNEIGTMSLPSSGGTSRFSTDCVFNGCDQVTNNGADMDGTTILASTVAADIGALLYNEASDPDGTLDNLTLTSGAAAHHAIDFGTNVSSSLTSITLRGCNFNGFGATDDANDSTLRFLATTGSLTLNLIDCTVDGVSPVASGGGKNFSVHDTAGMTVTVVVQPVTLEITVKDKSTLLPIENVQTSIHTNDAAFAELMNKDTNASGVASEAYGGATPEEIVWRCRKSEDTDDPRYFAASGIDNITSDGFALTVLMEENTILPEPPAPSFAIIQTGYNNASGATTSITVSPTLTAGTGRKLLVWGAEASALSATISATYDGNSMNSINSVVAASNAQQDLFEYDIPDGHSGSKDIVVSYAPARTNRSVMFAIIAGAATGTEEDETSASATTGTTADSSMTSTSTDTIFVQGCLLTSSATNIGATNGATEEFEQAFDNSIGHIVYEIRTASGADTIGASWTTSGFNCKNSCVIAQA